MTEPSCVFNAETGATTLVSPPADAAAYRGFWLAETRRQIEAVVADNNRFLSVWSEALRKADALANAWGGLLAELDTMPDAYVGALITLIARARMGNANVELEVNQLLETVRGGVCGCSEPAA